MDNEPQWHDIREFAVEGRGWNETKSFYDRLPAKAEGVVRDPVWELSLHSAGMCARFVTDAEAIHGRWTLRFESLAMDHMAATGVSGLDLYVKTADDRLRWLGLGRVTEFPTNTGELISGIPAGNREYMLYLPLYNGVTSVEVGIAASKTISAAPPRRRGADKPIVFYGTSITHGACASRPGMCHTAMLGRRFDLPVINLGFSGSGTMDPEFAPLMAELEAAAYVIDCAPNMVAGEITERTEPFVRTLRKAHSQTPILLVEDRTYSNAFLVGEKRERNDSSRAALRAAYQRLLDAGTTNLHYLAGETLLGDDCEGTVDSSHPNDLGFIRQADAFEKALRPALQRS